MDANCRTTKELISGAVDGNLSAEELSYFGRHVESCESCRTEFELERLTKNYFKGKVRLLEPPEDLLEKIRSRLDYEDSLQMRREHLPRSGARTFLWPAVGIAAVVVLTMITIFTRKSARVVTESSRGIPAASEVQTRDAFALAVSGFENLLAGEFQPQIKTQAVDEIIGFVKHNAGYSIPLPVTASADWVGGSVTTFGKEKIVKVAYKMGTHYIYIYAFPTQLAHSNAISLPRECIGTLDKSEWYWRNISKGGLQVAWMYKGVVCIATSNLERKELSTYLKEPRGSD
jgi:predicted anti-sigma-YlaC factor YlaD